ncbi:MAG: 5-dehydro-2-deoxygluconokinase [Christensenellales bacterium]|jgi:5-dehydro-2-deoxygluconokinase
MILFDNNKEKDVIAFGRATIDLYANEIGPMEDAITFTKYVGGSPANTAVAMANLGLDVGYIGRVSDDQLGRYIIRYLKSKKVDVSHIVFDNTGARSGITIGEIKSPEECSYIMYRSNCADLNISPQQLDESYIKKFKMILISGTSLSHSPAREAVFLAMEYARRNGVKISLDLDYREKTWSSLDSASVYYALAAEKADIIMGTRDEYDVMERRYLVGNKDDAISANRLFRSGAALVLIKKGKQGSVVFTADGKRYEGKTYPAKIIKTFGAGDAFSGAFNYCIIHKKSISEALNYAAAAASITISGHSCSESTPTLDEIKSYMQQYE